MSPERTDTDNIIYGFMTASARPPSYEADRALDLHRSGQDTSVTSLIPKPDAWKLEAECRDVDTDIFFPEEDDPEREQKEKAAKTICEQCIVRVECRTVARAKPKEKFGVWGGETEKERLRAIKNGNRRQAVTSSSANN